MVPSPGLIRARKPQKVLGNEGEDQVRRDGCDLVEPRLPPLALNVVLLRKGKPAKRLHGRLSRHPRGLSSYQQKLASVKDLLEFGRDGVFFFFYPDAWPCLPRPHTSPRDHRGRRPSGPSNLPPRGPRTLFPKTEGEIQNRGGGGTARPFSFTKNFVFFFSSGGGGGTPREKEQTFCQGKLDPLIRPNLPSKDLPLVGVGAGAIQKEPSVANALGRDEDPLRVHSLQDVTKALALLANEARRGHNDVVKEHLSGGVVDHGPDGPDSEALLLGLSHIEEEN